MLTTDDIRATLATVKYPGFSRDIVSFGIVKDVRITDGEVFVQMAMATTDAVVPAQIKADTEAALAAMAGVTSAVVRIDITAPAQQPDVLRDAEHTPLPSGSRVKHGFVVYSGGRETPSGEQTG